jgi:hypothetical protein
VFVFYSARIYTPPLGRLFLLWCFCFILWHK